MRIHAMRKHTCLWTPCLLLLPVVVAAQDKGEVVEEVVARVNNEVITKGDLANAQKSLEEDAHQDCPTCSDAQIGEKVAAAQKDLLRDLIDNSLLVQRG